MAITHIIEGTAAGEVIFATDTQFPSVQYNYVFGKQGNDSFVRDRTGGYLPGGASDMHLYGGFAGGDSGYDTVTYTNAATGVTVSLTGGWAQAQPLAGASFGRDWLFGVEAAVGSAHGDHLSGSSAPNRLWGHDGADDLFGGGAGDTLYGGQGNDDVYGGSGADRINGEGGNDRLYGVTENDTLTGGDGADSLYGGDGHNGLWGDGGNDQLHAGDGNDMAWGGDGADVIHGGSGGDVIDGGSGSDAGYGGSGRDTFLAGGGSGDAWYGGSGLDVVQYNGGADAYVNIADGIFLRGTVADDISGIEEIMTGSGDDTVFGAGDAVISTRDGNDAVYTGWGDVEVYGGGGHDVLVGYNGEDYLIGDLGNDGLYGGGGSDVARGGAGRDTLDGGDGDDDLGGGAEADVFRWEAGDGGVDRIRDFHLGQDRISFGPGYFAGDQQAGFDPRDHLGVVGLDGVTYLHRGWSDGGQTLDLVARFDGVGLAALGAAVDSGAIFHVATTGLAGGAPGGLGQAPGDNPFGTAFWEAGI